VRVALVCLSAMLVAGALPAQVTRKFPPDSLVNTKVIPHNTPVLQVIGQMRNFTSDLGVRCQFCHEGEEGLPLERFDFPSDKKPTKVAAQQMMRMVQEINRRLDSLPAAIGQNVQVTCRTCHHGVQIPMPLAEVVASTDVAAGPDSAIRAYQALRTRFFGRDAYDFGEGSLNTAAFRLGRAGKPDDGLRILTFNETLFPGSSGMYVFRGNIQLMRGDTSAAAVAFREAIRRDTTNAEARGRLQAIGR